MAAKFAVACVGIFMAKIKNEILRQSLTKPLVWKKKIHYRCAFPVEHNQRLKVFFSKSAPVAHLVVHRAVTRAVVNSRLRPDQHSGSKITEEKSAAFLISSANG